MLTKVSGKFKQLNRAVVSFEREASAQAGTVILKAPSSREFNFVGSQSKYLRLTTG
jgi:hypothetical protein